MIGRKICVSNEDTVTGIVLVVQVHLVDIQVQLTVIVTPHIQPVRHL